MIGHCVEERGHYFYYTGRLRYDCAWCTLLEIMEWAPSFSVSTFVTEIWMHSHITDEHILLIV